MPIVVDVAIDHFSEVNGQLRKICNLNHLCCHLRINVVLSSQYYYLFCCWFEFVVFFSPEICIHVALLVLSIQGGDVY